jgi:hypothetical protein
MTVARIAILTMRAIAAVITGVILAEILRMTVGLSGGYVTLVVSSLIVGGVAGYGTGVVAGRYELFWAAAVGALDGWWLFIDAPTLIGDTWFIRAWAVLTVPASMLGGQLRILQRRGRRGTQTAQEATPAADRWAFHLGAALCIVSFPVGFLVTAVSGNPRGGIFAFPLLGLGLVLLFGARRFR